MENYRSEIIDAINKAIEEIERLKKELEMNKNDLDGLKNLNAWFKQIEDALKPKHKWLKGKADSLELIKKELSNIRFEVNRDREVEMFDVIGSNLLDGMRLQGEYNNAKSRNIMFGNALVGSIKILESSEEGTIKIKVKILDNDEDIFDITDTNRMYNIISCINTKYNYNQ